MSAALQIFVPSLAGETITLHVRASAFIARIKGLLQDRLRIPIAQQRLLYACKQLEDQSATGQPHLQVFERALNRILPVRTEVKCWVEL